MWEKELGFIVLLPKNAGGFFALRISVYWAGRSSFARSCTEKFKEMGASKYISLLFFGGCTHLSLHESWEKGRENENKFPQKMAVATFCFFVAQTAVIMVLLCVVLNSRFLQKRKRNKRKAYKNI